MRRSRASLRSVLFDADAGALGLEAYTDTIHEERVTVVDDPVLGSSRQVFRFEVHDTDVGPTDNPRAQIASPRMIIPGDGVWVGWCTLFPEGFPGQLPEGRWPFLTLAEVYGKPYAGAAPVRVAMRAGTPGLSVMHGFEPLVDFGGPLRTGVWYDFALFQHMSPDPGVGFAQLWVNTGAGWGKVLSRNVATITSANGDGPNYHKLASYRYPGMFDVLTLYHGEHKVGRTFRDVAPSSHAG